MLIINLIVYILTFESFAFCLTNGNDVFLNYFILFYYFSFFQWQEYANSEKSSCRFSMFDIAFRVHFVIGVFDSLSSPCKMKKLGA